MTQQRPPGFKSGRSASGRPGSGKPQAQPHGQSRGHGQGGREERKFGDRPKAAEPAPQGKRFAGPKLSLTSSEAPVRERTDDRSQQKRPQQRPQQQRGRAPAVPNGAVWLYGVHAVGAALGNPARRLRRLVITEEADAALTAELPKPWPIQPEIASRERIDQLLGAGHGTGIVHQGVALLTDQLTAPPLLEALKRPGPVLVLDQISDPRNIGALMRTAQAFGAAMVIAQERNAPEETGALAKAASGALEQIPLLRIVNIARALIVLKAANIWVIGLDGASPNRLNGAAFAARRVALVLGNEGEGMRRLTRESCDEVAALAMPGGMESLNVSAAGAVALYELTRAAG
jgi:23S rRNA (guanosine2251-2'-O)-methyltransferase